MSVHRLRSLPNGNFFAYHYCLISIACPQAVLALSRPVASVLAKPVWRTASNPTRHKIGRKRGCEH
eukprot:scaffold66407_cov24-Prasinocladus_malaysianus.AAC.1